MATIRQNFEDSRFYIDSCLSEYQKNFEEKDLATLIGYAKKIGDLKDALSWKKDLEPNNTKFKAISEPFSKILLKEYENPLTASYMVLSYTNALREKIRPQQSSLKISERKFIEKVIEVFNNLKQAYLTVFNERGLFLNKVDMNWVAYKNYERAARNLELLCLDQNTMLEIEKDQAPQKIKSYSENPSKNISKKYKNGITELLEEKYPNLYNKNKA